MFTYWKNMMQFSKGVLSGVFAAAEVCGNKNIENVLISDADVVVQNIVQLVFSV